MKSSELSELYKNRFSENELSRKNAIWKVICEGYLQQYISNTATVVDVACGYGEFLNNIVAAKKVAIDLNPDAQKYLAPEVEFNLCSATEFSSVIEPQVDVVFTSNFLEHLPDKPTLNAFLDEVNKCLKSNGRYIVLGPNLRYLPGKYWDFYDHHLGLTHLSLSEALRLKGFEIEICVDKFLPFSSKGGLPTHPLLVWFYLNFSWCWRIFGKQFLIVARKL